MSDHLDPGPFYNSDNNEDQWDLLLGSEERLERFEPGYLGRDAPAQMSPVDEGLTYMADNQKPEDDVEQPHLASKDSVSSTGVPEDSVREESTPENLEEFLEHHGNNVPPYLQTNPSSSSSIGRTPDPDGYEALPEWQKQFSATDLPVELSILEPQLKRAYISKNKEYNITVVKNGQQVLGADGKPLRKFLYQGHDALPDRIPKDVEIWRILAWQAWIPEISVQDLVVRMHDKDEFLSPDEINRTLRRLNTAVGRWRRDHGGLSPKRMSEKAFSKNELYVLDRVSKKPLDWYLNTKYNTVWIVDEKAGTIARPDEKGHPSNNKYNLPQAMDHPSRRIQELTEELTLRRQRAIDFENEVGKDVHWWNLQYGKVDRHAKRVDTIAERRDLGISVFKKPDHFDTVQNKEHTEGIKDDGWTEESLPYGVMEEDFQLAIQNSLELENTFAPQLGYNPPAPKGRQTPTPEELRGPLSGRNLTSGEQPTFALEEPSITVEPLTHADGPRVEARQRKLTDKAIREYHGLPLEQTVQRPSPADQIRGSALATPPWATQTIISSTPSIYATASPTNLQSMGSGGFHGHPYTPQSTVRPTTSRQPSPFSLNLDTAPTQVDAELFSHGSNSSASPMDGFPHTDSVVTPASSSFKVPPVPTRNRSSSSEVPEHQSSTNIPRSRNVSSSSLPQELSDDAFTMRRPSSSPPDFQTINPQVPLSLPTHRTPGAPVPPPSFKRALEEEDSDSSDTKRFRTDNLLGDSPSMSKQTEDDDLFGGNLFDD
ncbi:MAG: hypothetical protein M1820_000207 [Bogoriella megaspora]|nr:MAG: hypothetical protein M1820_000207 [Bogoriella megaspora]